LAVFNKFFTPAETIGFAAENAALAAGTTNAFF